MRGVRVIARGREHAVIELEPRDGAALRALTPAQRAVAQLAIEGLSNREIAARRGIAARTVANHLAAIFRTLRIGSRAQLVLAARPNK